MSRRRSYINLSSLFSDDGRRHSFSCVPNSSSLARSVPEVRPYPTQGVTGSGRGDSILSVGTTGTHSASVKLSENPMKTKRNSTASLKYAPTPAPPPPSKVNSKSHGFEGVRTGQGENSVRQSSFTKLRSRLQFENAEAKNKKIKRRKEKKRKRKVTFYRIYVSVLLLSTGC